MLETEQRKQISVKLISFQFVVNMSFIEETGYN